MYRSDDEQRMKHIEEKLDRLEKQGLVSERMMGREYKSERRILGMPLVHVSFGVDPETMRPRVARGFFAFGNIAIGVFAFGGMAFGVVAFGGISLAIVAIGGMAAGLLLGAGGMAVGYIALGGMAIGYYAVGGLALGAHAIGGNAQDPEFLNLLRRIFNRSGAGL